MIKWLLGFLFWSPALWAHQSSGSHRFLATFAFTSDSQIYQLGATKQGKEHSRWHGWDCTLVKSFDQTQNDKDRNVFGVKASCSKQNAFIEVTAKCGVGFGEMHGATGGTRSDFVNIVIVCDGGEKFEGNPSQNH